MEKKEINSKTAIKGLINGFIAYGFLILFIAMAVIVVVSWFISQYKDFMDYTDPLNYTLPTIASFIFYFLVRRTCQLSTYDLFKKCKINKEDVKKVSKKITLFFICCIAFVAIVVILLLTMRFSNEKLSIYEISDSYYEIYSEEFAESLTLELIYDFQLEKYVVVLQAVIMEVGLLAGLISLIPDQEKFINRYNYIEKENEAEKQIES